MFFIRRNKQYNESQPTTTNEDVIGSPKLDTLSPEGTSIEMTGGAVASTTPPEMGATPETAPLSPDPLATPDPLAVPTVSTPSTETPSMESTSMPASVAAEAGVVSAPDLTNPSTETPPTPEATVTPDSSSMGSATEMPVQDPLTVSASETSTPVQPTVPEQVSSASDMNAAMTNEAPVEPSVPDLTVEKPESTDSLQVVEDKPIETPAMSDPETAQNNSEFTEAQMAKITSLAEAAAARKVADAIGQLAETLKAAA